MCSAEDMIRKAEDKKCAAQNRITVKDLRKLLAQYEDDTIVCIYGKMECFYEPLKKIQLKSVKPHCDVYADRSHSFMPEYRKEINKKSSCAVLALFY